MDRSDVLKSISDLSVLVITSPQKWRFPQFHPSPLSERKVDWFEGTGTIIGLNRNRVFIISSIHCIPDKNYSYFIKGLITNHVQQACTLCVNYFVEESNGIDVAILSCSVTEIFSTEILLNLSNLKWRSDLSLLQTMSSVWLVHFPTNSDAGVADMTERLHSPVFPTISSGIIISTDESNLTFDSTIIATSGSSGGLIIAAESGFILGVHDSQHNEHVSKPGELVSTHRMTRALQLSTRSVRQLNQLFND